MHTGSILVQATLYVFTTTREGKEVAPCPLLGEMLCLGITSMPVWAQFAGTHGSQMAGLPPFPRGTKVTRARAGHSVEAATHIECGQEIVNTSAGQLAVVRVLQKRFLRPRELTV